MSDLCHCAEPAPERLNGNLFCLNCRLWYDESAWLQDSRVKRARSGARQFTKEQEDIVNNIMREGGQEL